MLLTEKKKGVSQNGQTPSIIGICSYCVLDRPVFEQCQTLLHPKLTLWWSFLLADGAHHKKPHSPTHPSRLTSIGNPTVVSTLGIPILVRQHFYIESAPRLLTLKFKSCAQFMACSTCLLYDHQNYSTACSSNLRKISAKQKIIRIQRRDIRHWPSHPVSENP